MQEMDFAVCALCLLPKFSVILVVQNKNKRCDELQGMEANYWAESKADQCCRDKWDQLSAYWRAVQTKGELTAAVGGPDPSCFLVGKRDTERQEAAPRAKTW